MTNYYYLSAQIKQNSMKKIGIYFMLATFAITLISAYPPKISYEEKVECDSKSLKKAGISELNPFYYSSSKVTVINYDYKAQRKEIEVPLFKGEKYRMVFNKSDLPKDVVIKIFERDQEHSGRKPIFSSEDVEGDIISYEPEKSRKLYVDYMIPAAQGTKEGGCLVFILGYQLTFITDKEKAKDEASEEASE